MNAERSAALVRRWVALYTRGLPEDVRWDRRDEIDDDLWSQAHDPATAGQATRSLAGEVVARLVLGIPADLIWRVEQIRHAGRQASPRRTFTMNAPGLAFLAILGGIGWTVWPIPQAIVGREWPAGDPLSMVLFLSVVGGTFALAGTMGGLVYRTSDKIRTWVAVVAWLGAFVGAVSVFGAFGAIVLMPVGSALLLWELRRIGVVGSWQALAHIAATGLLLVVIGVIFYVPALFDDRATAVPLLALAIPYGLTWIAIGWSVYRASTASRPASA